MSAKEPRREIAAEAGLVEAILMQLFPHGADGIGTHIEELGEAGIAAQVASNLFRRAAEVHQGLTVSWKKMCDAAFLSAAASQLKESQDVLEPLLRQLGVELVRQDNWRKGAALPGFRVMSDAGQERTPGCCDGCGNADPRWPKPCQYEPERGSQGDWICTGWRPQEDVDAILDLEAEQPAPASGPEDVNLCQSCVVHLYDPPCPRMSEYSGGACADYLQPVPECCQTCFNTFDPSKPCPHEPELDSEENLVCEGWEDVPPEIRARFMDDKVEQPVTASEPEDLTVLDGEPENLLECACCTARINTHNEGVIVDGSLLCANCHAEDQLPRCCACGEAGELSPDDSGDLVCKDCLRADPIGTAAEHVTSCVQCSAVVDLNVAGSGEIIPDVGVICERCLNKDAGEPEICSGCGNQYSTCGYQPGAGDCEGFSR